MCIIINTLMTPAPLPRRPRAPGIDPAEARRFRDDEDGLSEAWRFQDDAEPIVIAPPEAPAAELPAAGKAAPAPLEWSGPVRSTRAPPNSRRYRSTKPAKCTDSVDSAGRRTDWPPRRRRRRNDPAAPLSWPTRKTPRPRPGRRVTPRPPGRPSADPRSTTPSTGARGPGKDQCRRPSPLNDTSAPGRERRRV
jgi:hypothetical protein